MHWMVIGHLIHQARRQLIGIAIGAVVVVGAVVVWWVS